MRIIIEEVDGSHYQDIILNDGEATELLKGRLIEGMIILKGKRYYIGVRVGDIWRHSDDNSWIENQGE